MTRDPLAGLILAGFDGTEADHPNIRELIELGIGGFIVFGRNVSSAEQVHSLLEGIRAACGDRPVFFAVDQEGGRVARLRAPLTEWPPMARLGENGNSQLAQQVGHALAQEIGAFGFNLVFAPVLDVRFEGTTDAIGDRSLGYEADRVSELGGALIEGIQSAGLVACGKHFPGHGHVTVDSHVELPVCSLDRAELMDVHVAPFAAAARAGVGAIMTAHVRYPSVDATSPGTFSGTWLRDILRGELGFEGLILTDDLEMGAVTGEGTVGAACVRAVRAGADGLLICHSLDAIRDSIAALRAAADQDIDFLASCVDSLARIQRAASLHPPSPSSLDRLASSIGTEPHKLLSTRLASASAEAGADPTAYTP